VALVAALVLGNGALSAKAQTSTPTPLPAPAPTESTIARTITVVGRGEVKVKPELATTTVGVDVQGATVEAAMEDAQARMTAILAALKQLGIADKDIQTSNFSISFERQVPEPRVAAQATPGAIEPPAGFYRLSNMVTVTIRDLTKVAEVLDTAVKAGANNVWGITFGLDDTDALEAQAREAAVKDALARAQTLAQLNGVEVGEVVSISEIVGSTPGPMYDMAVRAQGGGGTPVEPGEVAFSTQIQIVYSIR